MCRAVKTVSVKITTVHTENSKSENAAVSSSSSLSTSKPHLKDFFSKAPHNTDSAAFPVSSSAAVPLLVTNLQLRLLSPS